MKAQGKFGKLAVLAVATSLLSFSTLAVAESEAARAIRAAAATVPTNIPGIHTYTEPPKGFNPVTATDVELATYGFPARPDKQAKPDQYDMWERAMLAAKVRWNGELKPLPGSGNGTTSTGRSRLADVVHPAATGPMPLSTINAAGVVLTNKLKSWNSLESFDEIGTQMTVPTAQSPFGVSCDGGKQTYTQLSFVGIDGYIDVIDNQNVFNPGVWGGVYSTGCGNSIDDSYFAAFGSGGANKYNAFEILNGDVFLVQIEVSESSQSSSVFLEDYTLQTYNSYSVSTPDIIGNEAEWIVGRPTGLSGPGPDGLFAQPNTIAVSFDRGSASNGDAKSFYPGSQASSTYIFTMTDDAGDQPTEKVYGQGSSGYQGLSSLLFITTGCAYSGGCTP